MDNNFHFDLGDKTKVPRYSHEPTKHEQSW